MTYSHPSIELEYYVREGISPVHYNLSNLNVHFQIRASLYRLLGLVPDFVREKDVLEIAPGSGHNSIYTASLCPKNYDLVEPNPNGCKDILKIFKKLKIKHTKPRLFQKSLDDFKSKKIYDLVITEGWPGGFLDYDKKMLRKLSLFVKPGGLLFISFFPPIGGMATYLRRLIGHRLVSRNNKIQIKTDILKNAFSSHLKQLKSMTRSHEHWIQDSILNPYICVAHNTPKLCREILDHRFQIYQSVPKFSNDWRWYKSLHGKQRKFNEVFLEEYNSISHCMIDYRIKNLKRSKKKNIELEKLCFQFAKITKINENLGYDAYIDNVQPIFTKIISNIKNNLPKEVYISLKEAEKILQKKNIKIKDVSSMKRFNSFFGREQCYLSFINES